MSDKEKLENAIRVLEGNYKSCVFRHKGELVPVTDIIALLKAQEPIAPILDGRVYKCGVCKTVMVGTINCWGNSTIMEKYCRECGRAVKWK